MADGSHNVLESIGRLDKEIGIIQRGAAIAVGNIKQHFGNLEPKYHESKQWADQVCDDQAFLLNNWENGLKLLGSLKAYEELGQCLHGTQLPAKQSTSRPNTNRPITLRDFLDQDGLQQVSGSAEDGFRRFTERVSDLSATFEKAASESNKIIKEFHLESSQTDAGDLVDRLMDEIKVVTGKINADYDHVLGLPDTQKSLSQASKIAQLHKNNFLPSLIQTKDEINQLLAQAVERKLQVMHSSAQYLQGISIIESTVSSVHSKLANLDVDNENGQVFDVLNFVVRLPLIYGSLLIECVKRQEWAEKMTADSSSLVEEMAIYKEEEARRRSRWVKEMRGVVDLGSLDEMALGIEVNVHSQKHRWPRISRDDINEHVQTLRELGDLDETLKELEELLKTLDAPSRHQSRRAKAFKNGSLHEATHGRSLLLRGDDEAMLTMRNEKTRLEDKLKSAESRVRKLEDLLHRQSQVGLFPRPSSATGPPASNGPSFERHASSPVTNFSSALSKARETGSRRPSLSSRRVSMNNDYEEKGLIQRVMSLESDLANEKAKSADLAKEATARANAEDLLKSQIREATSTKEDLLGNLEAQQREFDDERRLLHEDNNKVKIQLDQLEDEFDRVLDSREHEDKTRLLEEELENIRKNSAIEAERAHQQVESLKNESATHRKQFQRITSELQQQKDEKSELVQQANRLDLRLQNHDQARVDHQRALRATLLHLSKDDDAPKDFGALVDTVEAVAEKSAAHLEDIEDSLETLRADNVALEARVKGQDDEIYDLREHLGSEERKVFSLHEELSAQRTTSATLQAQLDFERREHEQLKTKFAAGETDSNTLRNQLNDKERVIGELLGNVARHEARVRDLDGQLSEQGAKLEIAQNDHNAFLAARDAQASRAGDISKRMLSQNAMLERLLEQIGLVVIKEEGTMVIQKVPRATSNSTMLAESMKRSLSGPMPTNSDQEPPSIESEILQWADAKDLDEMARRFSEFMMEATAFDTNTFSEAVHKRVKEIEHIARKWQKEARAYRDKLHRAQGEAHDRIALRNFKEGDLALFLPTRDQATKPWAAFNVGAPHCFLREQDSHNLGKRDWLIARISKVEERVVDLSRSLGGGLKGSGDQASGGDRSDTGTFPNDENPYELSDGLRWYLIDAAEEKPGAPINVGTGKVTVASAIVDAKGSIRMKKASDGNGATKTLTRSLDSRRSSTNSKKGLVAVTSNSPAGPSAGFEGMVEQSIDNAAAAAAASSNLQVTKDTQRAKGEDRPQSSEVMDTPASSGQDTEHVGNLNASNS